MKNKDEFINDIILSMSSELSNEDLRKLKNSLSVNLRNKEISDCCTELIVSDVPSWKRPFDLWIACKRLKNCSEETIKNYNLIVGNLLSTLQKDIRDITSNDIRGYIDWYQTTKGKSLSASYVNTLRRYFSSFFTWATNEGLTNSNPISSIEIAQEPYIIRKPFSSVDMEKLKRSCKTARDLALVETLYATGGRVSEVSKMNIAHINFYDNSLVIHGKRNKERVVYLTDLACFYIQEYLKERKDSNEALFVHLKAPFGRLSKSGIEARMRQLGELSEVKNVHPHRFRRTLATTALSRGIEPYKLRDLMGHNKLETTMIYCKIAQADIKHSYMKLMQ